MENRYIDPETGKFKDSKVSEITGGVAGGLAGSLGINALRSYQGFKNDLREHEELNRELPAMRQDHARVEQALGDAELLQQMRQNPQALADLSPEMQDHFNQVYDVADRLQGRSDFDKVHELPMKERLQRFIKGKPSLEGIDPELIEYVSGRYGARPFDPEVVDVLRQQAGAMGQDLDMFTEFAGQRPRFNMKNAIPTLDHYKPKQLLQTVKHPFVTGGAMLGVGAGMMADEYRRHLSNIAEREMQKEAGFSSVFKKLLPKKPPASPGPPPAPKKPLIPKAVKRTGLVLGAAGVGGYTAVKAKDDFAAGTKLAPSAQQSEGMDTNMNKQAELYAELQKVAFDGGSDDYWQTSADHNNRGPVKRAVDGAHEVGVNVAEGARGLAGRLPAGVAKGLGIGAGAAALAGAGYGGYQLYQGQEEQTASSLYVDLQKVAFDGGSDDYWQASADHNNRGPVKRAVDGAHEVGVNVAEGARGLAGRLPAGVAKGLGIGAGAAALAGAGYGGYQLYQGQEEQTAASLYAELSKEAGAGSELKKSLSSAGSKVKETFSGSRTKQLKEYRDELADMDMLEGNRADILKKKIRNSNLKTWGARAGAGAAAGGTVAGGVALSRSNQEKTAADLYEELSKEAGAGSELKKSLSSAGSKVKETFSGSRTKQLKEYRDELADMDMLEGNRADILEKKIRNSNLKTWGARAGAGAAAGGAVAGGVALSHSNREKTAADLYEELLKEAGAGSELKKSLSSAGSKVKETFSGSRTKQLKEYRDELAGKDMLEGNRADVLKKKIRNSNLKTWGARAGAGAAAGGTVAGGVALSHSNREKEASEIYVELLKEAGLGDAVAKAGNAIKSGAGILAGSKGKGIQSISNDLARNGRLTAERATKLQGKADAANSLTNKARIGVGAGLALGGASYAGGKMAGQREKTASEQEDVYQENEPTKGMVVDHAIDGAKLGAGIYGGMGALSGGVAALRMNGMPLGVRLAAPIAGGIAGAGMGVSQGGSLGLYAGLGARHNQKQHYEDAQAAIANGETPEAPGPADKGVIVDQALKGAGIGAGALGGLGAVGGGALGLAAKSFPSGIRKGLPIAGGVGGAVLGANQGALMGAASGTGAYLNEKRRHEEAEQLASNETHDIEKIASESINALFGESTDAILNDKLEKIAGYTDPMERITFGYENLKK